ncbi:MAG: PAS domain S-box protein, partial [Phycisphaeraceae bacterium]
IGTKRLAEIVGYTPEELRKKTFGDITHPDDLDADWAQVARLIAGQIPNYSMEKRYIRKDGSTVWINLTVALVRKSTGEPDYFISVIENIDLRKQAEQALHNRTEEAEERAVQLRVLTSQLIHAEDQERRRIAQVLHDHLQQLLVAADFSLQVVHRELAEPNLSGQVERARALIRDSISESRSLTSELSPQVLYKKGLLEAVSWLAGWMQEKHGLSVRVTHTAAREPADEQTAVLLFQSIRELLFNVVKHADVREATVTLEAEDGTLRAVVEDRGRGFEPSAVEGPAAGDGFGHFAIRERLSMIGGRFEIVSSPGKGTRVTLEAPMRTETPAA